MQTGLHILKLSPCINRKLCLFPVPSLLTPQLDLSPVSWLLGGKNCTSPKNFPPSLQVQCRSQEGLVLLLGSPEACAGKVRLLYVSWFRKVGNESYHYPHIHTGAYSDGESSEEQSPSGGDVGQREVTFVHCLGGLQRRKCKTCQKYFLRDLKRKSDPFFKRIIITEAV